MAVTRTISIYIQFIDTIYLSFAVAVQTGQGALVKRTVTKFLFFSMDIMSI